MNLKQVKLGCEVHTGSGAQGQFILGDAAEQLRKLAETHAGQVKLIYMDPPFQTGDHFSMQVRVGENDWRTGRGSLRLQSYDDTRTREDFLSMMRQVLEQCRLLLREDGMIFVHIDYRAHAHLRLMMDEIFGEDNFLNEIIWVYQTGGRSLKYFSRKHDVILFYRRSAAYDFNIQAVMAPPTGPKNNHMRRHVDPDGRVYRSIKSNGRVYTYYDDEPVAPTDVWADLAHLQQRDPERTGYDTQKPLALLERIVKCASREGETVLDPFCGSGTTLDAAKRLGRNFIGIDNCPLTMNIVRRRLKDARYELIYPSADARPDVKAVALPGIGFYHVVLERFRMEDGACDRTFDDLDAVDNWSVGYIRDGKYVAMAESLRTRKAPRLNSTLDAPVYSGTLALCVSDVLGRSFIYELESGVIHTDLTSNDYNE